MISKFSFSYSSSDSVWPPSSLVAQRVKNPPAKKKKKNPPATEEAWAQSLGRENPWRRAVNITVMQNPGPFPVVTQLWSGALGSPQHPVERGLSFQRPGVHWPKFQLMPPADCEGDGEMQFRCL